MRLSPAVAICSSSKFYDTARRVADDLQAAGYAVHTPRFDFDERTVAVGADDKAWLTTAFLDGLRRCQVVYVVAVGGYTGPSVCLEIGYAAALGKLVVASEKPTEPAVAALVDQVVPADRLLAALFG